MIPIEFKLANISNRKPMFCSMVKYILTNTSWSELRKFWTRQFSIKHCIQGKRSKSLRKKIFSFRGGISMLKKMKLKLFMKMLSKSLKDMKMSKLVILIINRSWICKISWKTYHWISYRTSMKYSREVVRSLKGVTFQKQISKLCTYQTSLVGNLLMTTNSK